MAAQQAAANIKDKNVRVVPSTTIPQGIAAMFEYVNLCTDEDCQMEDVVNAMSSALPSVVTCEITNATRDAELEGVHVRAGQYIGLINDSLKVAGDNVTGVARDLLQKARAGQHERITVYYGTDASEAEARRLADGLAQDYPDQEFEVVNGGQALYPYIISIE
jgi:dihydroxyacetone kinase-like predicted kinase